MGMEHILQEPEGSPITVYSVQLYNQWKHRNEGKDDVLFITYKDKNHKKTIRAIKNPPMEIYFVKPEHRREFRTIREYLEQEKLYTKKVPARGVTKTIYEELKTCTDPQSTLYKSIYDQAVATENWRSRDEIKKWPYTLMSDMNVEDYYRIMLGYHYNTMRNHIIDKSYLDIEADTEGLTTSEQQANLDTVNACTVIFNFDERRQEKIKPQVFTFLLRNYKRYPQQKEFEKNIESFIQHCHDTLDHQEISKGGEKKIIDFEADYHINFYDTEAELLVAIFKTINAYKPDVCEVWNIAYDIPKIAARMEANGINYVKAMSDPSFPEQYQFVEMNIDKRPGIDIADRKTFIRMTSTTCFLDQMQNYAGIRKGRKAYGANTLDNISNIELGVGKHKFAKGVTVFNAARKDYYNFVYYNIIDVMRQVLIDMVTNDSMGMVIDMNQANCALENLTKQTRYQKQIYYTNYLRKGFVPGNNPNVNYIRGETEEYLESVEEMKRAKQARLEQDEYDPEDVENEEEVFDEASQDAAEEVAKAVLNIYEDSITKELFLPGGLVGNPDFNTETGTELIEGINSKHVFDYVMDMDYASEYPWAKYTRSLSKSTQYGRLIIPKKISDRQNVLPMGQEKRIQEIKAYLPGAEFTADYISHDVPSLGNVWFGLPTVTELDDKFMAKFGGKADES